MRLKTKMYAAALVSLTASFSAFLTSFIYYFELPETLCNIILFIAVFGFAAGLIALTVAFIMKPGIGGEPFYMMPKSRPGRTALISGFAVLLSFTGIFCFQYIEVVCALTAVMFFAGTALSILYSLAAQIKEKERSLLLFFTQIWTVLFIIFGVVNSANMP